MARSTFTLRIDEEERTALEHLSKIEGRPMNQLLNEAIKLYLLRRGSKERSLESSLTRLRSYRERDPEFRSAIAAFVEAEATQEDPLEGQLADDRIDPIGTAQSRMRELLGA